VIAPRKRYLQGPAASRPVRLHGDYHPGRRTSDQQIIYYKSNTGVGIQFAAAGASIYEACKKRGLGRELPTEWFGADLSE